MRIRGALLPSWGYDDDSEEVKLDYLRVIRWEHAQAHEGRRDWDSRPACKLPELITRILAAATVVDDLF